MQNIDNKTYPELDDDINLGDLEIVQDYLNKNEIDTDHLFSLV